MPLLARSVQTPLHIEVRRGAVADLGKILADGRISSGGDVAVVVGPGIGEQIVDLLRPSLASAGIYVTSGGTLDAALELADKLRSGNYDAVVGIGGGKTVDTAKYAASRWGLPMVSVATSLANDGIASPVASLVNDGIKGSYGVHIPFGVIVDLDFVENGPDLVNRAGIGDVISNISALADWELGRQVRGEPVDGIAASLSRMGAEAILNMPGDMADDAFVTVLAEALISSGLAMAVSGSSRPCSGGCHEIIHATDSLFPDTASHGELAGLGALFCTFLRGDERRFAQMADCLERHQLPRTPSDVGLNADQFVKVIEFAPRTRPDRYTILEHLAMTPEEIHRKLAEYDDAVAAR
ncbi:putative glycerol 1-phosphate dehydrogenase [Actinoplanes missouriensis 431]|uniref:Putative glycerol 1-phosphate dehydrogenase n=1 Tax=Actinoplanes missouriensis (strain ATCC 14538 / DSM 43046 / CBS 188.64 / JCM 3121 / NBRC 102363 / NCIMB 12654 / NRRL B-3342 / UNCC 431) TaxID=512565 RepID=I0HJQ0_ACTM4|nr:iron-containing alcohol dehydrogenase family protein [Actinoplanes missouriensis]BAL93237.1 putative glycerol 1-phosphate dehydrogenase [Actinoplanes missouriensis 431]